MFLSSALSFQCLFDFISFKICVITSIGVRFLWVHSIVDSFWL